MIAIATGYVDLDEKLKKSIKDSTIIGYREFLVKEESNFEIAIISSKLGGEIEIQQLLFVLKQKGTRIIYLTNEENKEEIIACFDLGIYDIVLDPIDDEKIEYVLKNPQSLSTPLISKLYVKYKNDEDIGDNKKSSLKDFLKKNEETKIVEKVVEVPVKVPVIVQKTVTKTIKQQVLTFYTTDNNLNKDEALTNFAVLLAKKTDQKILVIDADMPTPNLDMLFGIHKEVYVKDIYDLNRIDTGISACYGAIEKGIFSSDMLKEFVIKVPKLKNLYVLTGVYDLAMFFKKLEAKHYEEIIEAAKQIYDTIIIDVNPFEINTATYAALLNSSRIIVTCEPNWANARNSLTIIKDLIGRLKIPKEKFNFVINNMEQGGLSKDLLCKVFTGFKILGYLPYNKYHMKYLNNKKTFITSLNARNDIAAYMELIENLGYKAKTTLFQRVFKKNDEAAGVLDAESDNTLTSKETEKVIDEIKEDKKEKEGE